MRLQQLGACSCTTVGFLFFSAVCVESLRLRLAEKQLFPMLLPLLVLLDQRVPLGGGATLLHSWASRRCDSAPASCREVPVFD